MKSIEKIVVCVILLLTVNSASAQATKFFQEIYDLVENTNYFKAKELFEVNRSQLTTEQQLYLEAVITNAFNQLVESEKSIDEVLSREDKIADSLLFKLYEIRCDNAIKLYKYNEAKDAIHTILDGYKVFLNKEEVLDYENSLKIWTALEHVEPQRVEISGRTVIQMEKDKAGLNNLKVSADKKSFDFIFDTGANLSTTIHSVAKQLKMKLIPVEIDVMTITGTSVVANLAVCEQLALGNIRIQNAIFLVLPDKALSFKEINYQIDGIIGFPIIEALNEIQLTKDGRFIVPEVESTFTENSNMAMNELTPLININDMHFTFDTGAARTMLYSTFYAENKSDIDKHYTPKKISFGGANGMAEFDGFLIDYTFEIGGKDLHLKKIDLVKTKIRDDESSYGNIGQDLIQEFDSMILNFRQMFIKFE